MLEIFSVGIGFICQHKWPEELPFYIFVSSTLCLKILLLLQGLFANIRGLESDPFVLSKVINF